MERHAAETGSRRAGAILSDWSGALGRFIQVCPREMLPHLRAPLAPEMLAVPAE